MNIEEIDKWLDREYGVSYTKLEELHDWLCDREIEKDEEIERLHSIIKEVREYPDNAKDNCIINKHQYVNFDNIKEILDKENI